MLRQKRNLFLPHSHRHFSGKMFACARKKTSSGRKSLQVRYCFNCFLVSPSPIDKHIIGKDISSNIISSRVHKYSRASSFCSSQERSNYVIPLLTIVSIRRSLPVSAAQKYYCNVSYCVLCL